jgi:hypothetical protein
MTNFIEQYDQELLEDISAMPHQIADWKSREVQSNVNSASRALRSKGCPPKIADDIAEEEIAEDEIGTSIHAPFEGLLDLMKELAFCIKDFPFRIDLSLLALGGVDEYPPEILFPSSRFQFNLSVLDDDERGIFLKHMKTIPLAYNSSEMHHCYPSAQLMQFIQSMLLTSRRKQFLVTIRVEKDDLRGGNIVDNVKERPCTVSFTCPQCNKEIVIAPVFAMYKKIRYEAWAKFWFEKGNPSRKNCIINYAGQWETPNQQAVNILTSESKAVDAWRNFWYYEDENGKNITLDQLIDR